MTINTPLGAGPEFDRIRAIVRALGDRATGIGDDCALLDLGGTTLAVSIDASVEGVHFRTDWLSFEEIGWRAAAAALSDLAAEGAEARGVLVALGGMGNGGRGGSDSMTEIMKGVGAAAASVGAKVLGGDLVKSDKYVVDVCVLGVAERPVTRAGARAGDGVWVTGTLGGAGLALGKLQRGERLTDDLRARYARPIPRIAAGRWLAAHGAGAMIDVSDGLAADLGHIAAASGVGIGVVLEKVPSWPGVAPLDALGSGEEFELAVVLPPAFDQDDATQFMRECGVPLTLVGACAPGVGVTILDHGRNVPAPAGFDHFASP